MVVLGIDRRRGLVAVAVPRAAGRMGRPAAWFHAGGDGHQVRAVPVAIEQHTRSPLR